jgi:hypothetical protein
MATIMYGQIWREVDPRFTRYVRVESDGQRIGIRAVVKAGDRWVDAPRSRLSYADRSRFDGRRGGYELLNQP